MDKRNDNPTSATQGKRSPHGRTALSGAGRCLSRLIDSQSDRLHCACALASQKGEFANRGFT